MVLQPVTAAERLTAVLWPANFYQLQKFPSPLFFLVIFFLGCSARSSSSRGNLHCQQQQLIAFYLGASSSQTIESSAVGIVQLPCQWGCMQLRSSSSETAAVAAAAGSLETALRTQACQAWQDHLCKLAGATYSSIQAGRRLCQSFKLQAAAAAGAQLGVHLLFIFPCQQY